MRHIVCRVDGIRLLLVDHMGAARWSVECCSTPVRFREFPLAVRYAQAFAAGRRHI